jgi:hypothetical protein
MGNHQQVTMCCRAVPTLLLAYPEWILSEDTPWSCVRGGTPVPLETTDVCAGCPYFEPVVDPRLENSVGAASQH